MQFGCARTVPLFARGQQWFFGSDSVYWGHNALIRIAPFMAHCNLPVMPGKQPLGGQIMSQDIVEAALVCRAGWNVDWELDTGGSFDEMPANLLSYARRDRRWCQGNFQHFWLIFGDGMKPAHRFYFAYGIFTYAAAPLMLVLMSLGFVQGLLGRRYFWDSVSVVSFLGFFLIMFLGPKVLGYIRRVMQGARAGKELLSTGAEILISFIASPALIYLHARFVLEILAGRTTPWKAQARDPGARLDWRTAVRVLWVPAFVAAVWIAWAVDKTPGFLLYLVPMLFGWLVSIPVAVWTSSPAVGAWFARHGLLEDCLTAEEKKALGRLLEPEVEGYVSAVEPVAISARTAAKPNL